MSKRKNDDCSSSLLGIGAVILVVVALIKAILPVLLGVLGIFLLYKLFAYIGLVTVFYNRENGLNIIGSKHLLNHELTNKILAGQHVEVGNNSENLNEMCELYNQIIKSKIVDCKEKHKIDGEGRKLFSRNNIYCCCQPLAVIRYLAYKNKGYVFYVFPETILVFAEGSENCVFIGAYSLSLLNISYGMAVHSFDVVVEERTKYNIEYYYSYSPVPDAKIVHCDWAITNMDGSRSFKGGLLSANNPLQFELGYAEVTYQIGNLKSKIQYSNYSASVQFINKYSELVKSSNTEDKKL